MGTLEGKALIVTGAAQGTGEGVASAAVAEGARVLLTDIQEEKGRAVAEALGDAARFARLDVTEEARWQGAVEAAQQAFGRLDGLVNNAAVLYMGALEATPSAAIERVLRVNLLGTLLGTKAVIPALRAAGGGSIVNVTSTEALWGMNSVSAYTASKWGARGFTKAAAIELGRDGIRVNCVCPSAGNPEMYLPFSGEIDVRRYLEHVPPPVLLEDGEPAAVGIDHIAALVCFLLGDASRRITGVEIPIDAGGTAGRLLPGLPGF